MSPQKPAPKDWPRISSGVFYEDPKKAIDWLCEAFGFKVRLLVEGDGGRVEHSELTYGDGLIMVGGPKPDRKNASPRAVGGANTQSLMIYVDDVDAHCEHARKSGAKITTEPKTTDYGDDYWTDRSYEAEDPEGHRWWIVQRMRDPKAKA
ncbi:MAG: VOC family protein [Myxococcales bacterium]|nr:VOC family protein [Myxococcales bacterium]